LNRWLYDYIAGLYFFYSHSSNTDKKCFFLSCADKFFRFQLFQVLLNNRPIFKLAKDDLPWPALVSSGLGILIYDIKYGLKGFVPGLHEINILYNGGAGHKIYSQPGVTNQKYLIFIWYGLNLSNWSPATNAGSGLQGS